MDQLDHTEGLSPHDEILRSDKTSSGCTRVSWKLGQSVESLHGEGVGDDDDVEAGLLDHGQKEEDNNNAHCNGDTKPEILPRTGTSCVR